MSDLEGITRRMIAIGEKKESIGNCLIKQLQFHKEISTSKAQAFAQAVIKEINTAIEVASTEEANFLTTTVSGVKMGEQGVGSRGSGDKFVHNLIADICSSDNAEIELSPIDQDDAGAVHIPISQSDKEISGELTLLTAIDGMHSRLSEYSFIAGFHCTRAALRDILVKGAKPAGLIIDIHLADDADVGKLFDFIGGCQAVSKLSVVPILAGSTLRIGGDMVIGERMTGGVGAFGFSTGKLYSRGSIQNGDRIFLTKGSGGGTICTTAIFSGHKNIIKETLNIDFVKVSRLIQNSDLQEFIHGVTDVTNGGIRGDATEIVKKTGLGIILNKKAIFQAVNPKILKMLQNLEIDPLGVSIDSLMIFTDNVGAEKLNQVFNEHQLLLYEVGEVVNLPSGVFEKVDGKILPLKQKYREAAYTPLKKVVGVKKPENMLEMEKKLTEAANKTKFKIQNVIQFIEGKKEHAMG